ncbi:MAG: DUF4342 domain-containing protein [Coriobacteriales bacterium]|nr:DUF4342 domain-containing protein [Coriobacteriales bacterium]
MDKFEKAEKICEKTGVSFEDARAALEACDYDMLDAIVWLEQRGKTMPQTASYTTADAWQPTSADEMSRAQSDYERATSRPQVSQALGRIWEVLKRLARKGIDTTFVVTRHGNQVMRMPVLVLVVLLIFAFWFVLPALAIGLFCDLKYRFEGINPVTVDINDLVDKAADGVDNLKRDVKGEDF